MIIRKIHGRMRDQARMPTLLTEKRFGKVRAGLEQILMEQRIMCRDVSVIVGSLLLLLAPTGSYAQGKPWSTAEDSVGYWQMLFNREMGQTIVYCIDSVEVKSMVLYVTNDTIKIRLQLKNKRKRDIGLLFQIDNQTPNISMSERSRNGTYYSWLDFGIHSGDLLPRLVRLKKCSEMSRVYTIPKSLLPKETNYTNAIGFALSYVINLNGFEYLTNSKKTIVAPLKDNDAFNFYHNMRTSYFGYFTVYTN